MADRRQRLALLVVLVLGVVISGVDGNGSIAATVVNSRLATEKSLAAIVLKRL